MKSGNSRTTIQKDVVVIGNGPSGLALSYMLSGNIPYLISKNHPDEMLAARLHTASSPSLLHQDLQYLSSGLEGRTSNPISLLYDSLALPLADMGFEIDSLIEWRKEGPEIDHIVLGKDLPGGSWHKMDPCILTLSLGSWMALPGLPYTARDGSEKRASAGNVAQYYLRYIAEKNLETNFENNVCVTSINRINDSFTEEVDECLKVERVRKDSETSTDNFEKRKENRVEQRGVCDTREKEDVAQCELQKRKKICSLSNALNFIHLRSNRKCKRRRDVLISYYQGGERKIREVLAKSVSVMGDTSFKFLNESSQNLCCTNDPPINLCRPEISTKFQKSKYNNVRSISLSCDFDSFELPCDNVYSKSFNEHASFNSPIRNSYSLEFNGSVIRVPQSPNCDNNYGISRLREDCDYDTYLSKKRSKAANRTNWVVETYDTKTGNCVTYLCKDLILASGASDLPNRLNITKKDPSWLLHDVRSLELQLDNYVKSNPVATDPVLIIGAGLSAADAIISTRCRNIPVLHVFRNQTADFGKQLPENMYPEYHKVHQMMQDGGSTYPLYKALSGCSLVDINEAENCVKLQTKSGEELKYHVSFAAILIGSRPDLTFLPQGINLGLNKSFPVDNKTNTIDVNKFNNSVNGHENLYAMGPLVGDNFVRFIPGGALAIVSDLYKKYNY